MFSSREINREKNNSSAYLEYLLDVLADKPETREEITQKIEDVFGQDRAVMLIDMSGFCTKTSKHGIVHVLSVIYKMRNLLKPVIESENGKLIKTEGDSVFCIFENVADAVRVSLRINEYLRETNKETDEECQINVSVGIGYGHILNIEDSDLFGEEVNLASKLGEDIASKGEILLTENAMKQLRDSEFFGLEQTIRISGISLNYHAIK